MSKKFKEIDIKNRTYYFYDDMINIKYLDVNKIKNIEITLALELTTN